MMGWSPDGKRLLFASNRTGPTSLWSVPFADGKVEGQAEIIRANVGQGESMGVTRSGDFYYGVWSAPSTSSLEVASVDPRTGRILSTTHIPKEHSASDTQSLWSPDGNLLAYISDRGVSGSTVEQGGQRSLVLVIRSSDSNQIVREFDLNLSAGNGLLKGWTSDADALLVSGVDSKGRPGLFRVDAHTGVMSVVGFVSVKPPQEWSDGNWKVSADAANLYVRRQEPGCSANCTTQLYRRNVASGVEAELARGHRLGFVNLSPNDEYVAMPLTDPSTNSRTFAVIPTAGGPRRDLMRVSAGEIGSTGQGRNLSFAAWSPDSRYVLIREVVDDKPVAVWRASLDGAPPQKLDWAADQIAGRAVSISPNGTRIAYIPSSAQSTRSLSEIWVLEGLLSSSKAK
jgi:Tol biopolymer transport system component